MDPVLRKIRKKYWRGPLKGLLPWRSKLEREDQESLEREDKWVRSLETYKPRCLESIKTEPNSEGGKWAESWNDEPFRTAKEKG